MMNRQTFLAHLSIETHTLEVWIAQEWLVPRHAERERADTEPHFSDADLARARLIQHLKAGMGVNDEGIDVILHLLDQLHGVRQAFEGLHASLGQERP